LSNISQLFQIFTVDIEPNRGQIRASDAAEFRNNLRKFIRLATLIYVVFRANQLYINYTGNVDFSNYARNLDFKGVQTEQYTGDLISILNSTLLREDVRRIFQ
jgi:hypothetical protein